MDWFIWVMLSIPVLMLVFLILSGTGGTTRIYMMNVPPAPVRPHKDD